MTTPKYRSLRNALIIFHSVLFFRLFAGIVLLFGIFLTISAVASTEGSWEVIFIPSIFVAVLYYLTLYSSILYNATEIIVQNIFGKKVFKKSEFLRITPWKPYINIYCIEFKNGHKFLFSQGQLFIGYDAVKESEELSRQLSDN